ncbi:MAG: hypothetical protein ABI718_18065 [Acidobacteriota bacterium]
MKILFFALALLASGSAQVPIVQREARPPLTVNFAPFAATRGCSATYTKDRLACEKTSDLGRLGCSTVYRRDELGGLRPRVPIAVCEFVSSNEVGPGTFITRSGILRPAYVRFLVAGEKGFTLLSNEAEFRKYFAPVTSANEALSYVLAITGLTTFYGFVPPPNYRYMANRLRETFIEKRDQGFIVHNVLDYEAYGCGPHLSSLVTFSVSAGGELKEINRVRAFEGPNDHICRD